MKRLELVKTLRSKTIKDLLDSVHHDERELTKLQFDLRLGKTSTVKAIRNLRKQIARTQTVVSEKLHHVGASHENV